LTRAKPIPVAKDVIPHAGDSGTNENAAVENAVGASLPGWRMLSKRHHFTNDSAWG